MEIVVLDTSLKAVSVFESYKSLLWVERYSGFGDFEIYSSIEQLAVSSLRQDYYLWNKASKQVMIIEDIKANTDTEEGHDLIVTGRSLESILDRRIIWKQTILSGNLQNGIKKLLDENVISPTDSTRAIPGFVFKASTDPEITKLKVDTQFTGDNLYEAIVKLCEDNSIGFRITLSDTNQFVFELYAGVNRSYDQDVNPHIVFSPQFDNIINSSYLDSKKSLKTITLVAGEGEGADRKTVVVESVFGGQKGLNRRELYTDARDLSSNIEKKKLSDEEYKAQLSQRGVSNLMDHLSIRTFEGKVEATVMFKYGVDFFMGDIVQVVNEFGIQAKSRVVEIIRSQSSNGIEIYPTFAIIE